MLKKSDAVVYTSANRKLLAKIAVHMTESGVHLRSMSEMLRLVLETFEVWIDKKGAKPIDTTEEATHILNHMFKASLNPGNRYKKSLLNNLEEDELTWTEPNFESIDEIPAQKTPDPYIAALMAEYSKKNGYKLEEIPKEEPSLDVQEMAHAAFQAQENSLKEEQLTELQIERNKAILTTMQAKLKFYQEQVDKYRTDKAKEPYQKKIGLIMKFAERAKHDDEALRILVDEL